MTLPLLHNRNKCFSNQIELHVSGEHFDYKPSEKIMLYDNELVNCSSWGFALMGKAAELDAWLCLHWCAPPCTILWHSPPLPHFYRDGLISGHVIFALIYYNSFLLFPWLLVFLLPSVLQCLARVILPDLKSDITLTCDSSLFSGGGPPHTWMDSFPWAYSPSLHLLLLALQKGLENPTRAHHAIFITSA